MAGGEAHRERRELRRLVGHLHFEQFIACPRDEVFRFFENPYNLLELTPRRLNLRVTNRERVKMCADAEIFYTIRWLGLPLRWRTVIRMYDPPRSFCDEQVGGPYRKWVHTHSFVEEHGGTRIIDDVDYEMPFGGLGSIAERLMVRRQLHSIFQYRQKAMEKLFGSTVSIKP